MLDVLARSLEEGATEHMVILRHERGKLRISMKDGNTDPLHNGLFEEVCSSALSRQLGLLTNSNIVGERHG